MVLRTHDVIHTRSRWPLPQPLLQLIHGGRVAARNNVDAAIRQISRIAAKFEPQRFVARAGAKEHTLHFAGHEKTCAYHGINDRWLHSATPT